MYLPLTRCRACNCTDLREVFDLGVQPLANDFCLPGQERAGMAPLKVLHCERCSLAQLSVMVRPEILYANYPYVTSKSRTMRQHFETLGHLISDEVDDPSSVLEIGSNDGDFLSFMQAGGVRLVVGIDPAKNLADAASSAGVPTIHDVFSKDTATDASAMSGSTGFDVVVARHVFCHINDWQQFIRDLELVTHENSLVLIEVPYLMDMLERTEFDTIYHEHTSYLCLKAVGALLMGTPFMLQKVVGFPIHGGAVGLLIRRRDKFEPDPSILELLSLEIDIEDKWMDFRARSYELILSLHKYVKQSPAWVCGFGASAKSTVWINACKFTNDDIKFICDCTPQKIGRLSPGTNIPVVPESELEKVKTAVLFAWNFKSEILSSKQPWRDAGGKFIVPIPALTIE